MLDARHLLRLARRWLLLLLLTPVIAGLTTILADRGDAADPPSYTAEAVLLINPGESAGNYGLSTYRELVESRAVLATVIATLDLPFAVEDLQRMVATEPAGVGAGDAEDAQLLSLRVKDTEPRRAATIANTIARTFADFVGQQAIERSGPARAALDQQIARTKQEIDDTQEAIRALELSPQAAEPETLAQIDAQRFTLDQLQDSYSALLLTAQAMDLGAAAAYSRIVVVDTAAAPTSPDPEPMSIPAALLAAVAGFLVAAFTVVAVDYLDRGVRGGGDVAGVIGAPLLSAIPRISGVRRRPDQLYLVEQATSPAAEAIRLLRSNLEAVVAVEKLSCFAVNSPSSGDGRSTVTANLALAMAQSGCSVVVVDADFRRPVQHQIFRVPNERGLTTLLTQPDRPPWRSAAVSADAHPNLRLIPSGPLPPNAGDLLSLDRLPGLLVEIAQTTDIILLDTPPVLVASEALVVARQVDGVILVCRAGRTQRDRLQRTVWALQHGAIRILGAVMTQQTGREWAQDAAQTRAGGPLSTPASS